MKLNRARGLRRNGRAGGFIQEQYVSPQNDRRDQFQHFEALPALGGQVEAAVGIFLVTVTIFRPCIQPGKTFYREFG